MITTGDVDAVTGRDEGALAFMRHPFQLPLNGVRALAGVAGAGGPIAARTFAIQGGGVFRTVCHRGGGVQPAARP
ncbi:MAG: hypothetical protein ACR2FH_11500 [Caulobacteraceae bacterium]